MQTSNEIGDLAAAMAAAQGVFKPAIKDSNNPAFRSKYADLTSVVESCRAALAANGLTVWQDVTLGERGVSCVTRIAHTSGQWVEFGPCVVPVGKQDAHGVGSATSYARRYGLSAALGIVADDDDGNAAAGVGVATKTVAAPPPKGFAEWLMDLEASADEGLEALTAAWKASSDVFRAYVQDTDAARVTALKRRATKATGTVQA